MDEQLFEFEALLQRARQGDSEAVGILYNRYSKMVRRVVRRRLHPRLRRRYDSIDFVHSVWASFVELPSEDYKFDTPEELVAFLSRMASNKVINAIRKQINSRKQDARKDISLDARTGIKDAMPLSDALPSPTPTPSQVMMADERWQQLLARFPPGHGRVLELLRDGYSAQEIVTSLGLHPRLVRRLVIKLREYTERT